MTYSFVVTDGVPRSEAMCNLIWYKYYIYSGQWNRFNIQQSLDIEMANNCDKMKTDGTSQILMVFRIRGCMNFAACFQTADFMWSEK